MTSTVSPLVWLLRAPIHLYRWVVSPLLGPSCRYVPSCSEYALDALSKHGAVRGSWLAVRRILRCHPWGGSGWDPVPGTEGREPRTTPHSHACCDSGRHPQDGASRGGI
ncbi:membrane protein insertion efficiency factor YidD [Rhodocista pekingensis]|uniref:Putative membrane protein insertion efficiency factor n=1 Tax=Rhodocista pekingensis TaxID=201185 RepID=A0ABW2KUM2_9PROT